MEPNRTKAISSLQLLMTFACLLMGFLAGENIFRYSIEVPGWRHINIVGWGEYSRHADLGNGIFIFPLEGIVSALLLVVASIIVLKRKEFIKAALPVYMATTLALVGVVLTFLAAPYMLSVRTIGNDPALLQQTFYHFHHWGFFRAIAQVLSFCACVWGVGKVYELEKE
jgi:hypothetical protein